MLYVPYAAILAAFALVHLPRQIVSLEMKKLPGGYNNNDPRGQQAQLEGRGRRALAAHQNGFEAFAPFAAGVLAAMQRYPHIAPIAYLCIGFVVVRTLYIMFYLNDKATLRSGMWGMGMLATGALMILAIVGP